MNRNVRHDVLGSVRHKPSGGRPPGSTDPDVDRRALADQALRLVTGVGTTFSSFVGCLIGVLADLDPVQRRQAFALLVALQDEGGWPNNKDGAREVAGTLVDRAIEAAVPGMAPAQARSLVAKVVSQMRTREKQLERREKKAWKSAVVVEGAGDPKISHRGTARGFRLVSEIRKDEPPCHCPDLSGWHRHCADCDLVVPDGDPRVWPRSVVNVATMKSVALGRWTCDACEGKRPVDRPSEWLDYGLAAGEVYLIDNVDASAKTADLVGIIDTEGERPRLRLPR